MPQLFSPKDHRRALQAMHQGCDARAGRQSLPLLIFASFWYLGPGIAGGCQLGGPIGFGMVTICVAMLVLAFAMEARRAKKSVAMRDQCRILELTGKVVGKQHQEEEDWSEYAGRFTRDYYAVVVQRQDGRESSLWVDQGVWDKARRGELLHALVVSFDDLEAELAVVKLCWPERPLEPSFWDYFMGRAGYRSSL